MIDDPDSLKAIIEDLNNKHKPELAHKLLEHYYTRCETLGDYDTVGYLALKLSYTDISLKAAESAYAIAEKPHEIYAARSNLQKAYYAANYPEKSIFYTKLNLETYPDDFDAKTSLIAAMKQNGQREKAEKLTDDLIKEGLSDKQKRDIRSMHSHKILRSGKTGKGIDFFLGTKYKKDKATSFHLMGMQRWDGKPIKGKNLYLYNGGGFGDEFINIRFMDHVKELGMNPILYSNLDRDDSLEVFARCGYNVTTRLEDIDTSSPHTELMTLPVDLNLSEKDLWRGPYIKPLNQKKNKLKSKKFKIGIKCNGNPFFAQDVFRSIPIEQMLGVIPEEAEVYYFDLDKEHSKTINMKGRINNWDDTLDYISQMDVIFSSCTSLVHASGAMGVPTIVCTPILEYYVWTSSRTDNSTPWYGDNFWVMKQTKVRDWQEPLENARKVIKDLMNENRRDSKNP